MKRYTCVLALLFVAALAFPSTTFAEVQRFRGKVAAMEFYSTDPTGCIGTSLYVVAVENQLQEQGPRTTQGSFSLYFSQFDNCTFQTVSCGTAFGEVPDGALSTSRNLESATLNVPIQIQDCYSGAYQSGTVSLTWTGITDLSRSNNNGNYTYPGFRIHYRTHGESREASGTGTLTIGGTTTAFQDGVGYLSLVDSGTISTSH
jgi:type 1 fimbria pilin